MPSFPHQSLLRRSALPGLGCLAVCSVLSFAAARSNSRRAPQQKPHAPRPLVVGYFGQWSLYDNFFVKNIVTSGAANQLDQINYAQGFVTGGRCSVADPNADLNRTFTAQESVSGKPDEPSTTFHGNFHQLAELKRLHPRLKILISLEGHAPDFAADAQPAARQAFVASCVDLFLRGHLAGSPNVAPDTPDQPGLFDGIDLDWEYPRPPDAANFIALLTELRRQMDALRPGLRLTVAVGPSPRMYPGVDMAALGEIVDQVGIMNYDYIGPWSHTTGFLAPLHSPVAAAPVAAAPGAAAPVTAAEDHGSVAASILAFKQSGVPAPKLLMGLPFYGYGWRSVNASGSGLFQPGQGIRGDRPYPFFLSLLNHPLQTPPSPAVEPPAATPPTLKPVADPARPSLAPSAPATPPASFVLHRDPHSQAPWLYNGDTFWTFEDPVSIRHKAQFALDQQIGGVMIWELSEDAPDAALLKAARYRLNNPDPDL